HEYEGDKEAFEAGFNQLLLNSGTEKEEKVLMSTRKIIRNIAFDVGMKFPQNIKKAHEAVFQPTLPNKTFQFSYPEVIRLYSDQRKIDCNTLEKGYNYYTALMKLVQCEEKTGDEYRQIFALDRPTSLSAFLTCSQDEKFKPLRASMLKL